MLWRSVARRDGNTPVAQRCCSVARFLPKAQLNHLTIDRSEPIQRGDHLTILRQFDHLHLRKLRGIDGHRGDPDQEPSDVPVGSLAVTQSIAGGAIPKSQRPSFFLSFSLSLSLSLSLRACLSGASSIRRQAARNTSAAASTASSCFSRRRK